jgi:hypothetical protein
MHMIMYDMHILHMASRRAALRFAPRAALLRTPPLVGAQRLPVAAVRWSSDNYKSRSETRKGASHLSFWERWEKASAGEFYQGVGFDQDKKNDERFRKRLMRRKSAEFDEDDDIDDYDMAASGPSPREAAAQKARAAVYARARDELSGGEIEPSRKAELLGLLEDMGPHAFAPKEEMPVEPRYDEDIDEAEVRSGTGAAAREGAVWGMDSDAQWPSMPAARALPPDPTRFILPHPRPSAPVPTPPAPDPRARDRCERGN